MQRNLQRWATSPYSNLDTLVRPSSHDCDVQRPKPEEPRQTPKLLIYSEERRQTPKLLIYSEERRQTPKLLIYSEERRQTPKLLIYSEERRQTPKLLIYSEERRQTPKLLIYSEERRQTPKLLIYSEERRQTPKLLIYSEERRQTPKLLIYGSPVSLCVLCCCSSYYDFNTYSLKEVILAHLPAFYFYSPTSFFNNYFVMLSFGQSSIRILLLTTDKINNGSKSGS